MSRRPGLFGISMELVELVYLLYDIVVALQMSEKYGLVGHGVYRNCIVKPLWSSTEGRALAVNFQKSISLV
jgi:hypothetical protein